MAAFVSPAPRLSEGLVDGKAKLLLQRERELFELRDQRARAEEWLTALHSAWPDRFDVPLESLVRRVNDLLVGTLSFEYAAAFEYRVPTGELVFGCADPQPLPADLRIEPAVVDHFERHGAGRYESRDPSGDPGATPADAVEPLDQLAQALGLAKFFWRWCASQPGQRFLFIAGSGPRTAQFHTFPETDRHHFTMFANHAAALISNSLLIADVRRERAELEAANRGLDRSLRELEQTQQQLLASTQMVALASRQAGMAEIATGILHNVGNVLNSVNVCGEVALQRVRALPLEGLSRAVQLIDQQADPGRFFGEDPRGMKTIEYLGRLTESLTGGRAGVASELEQLMQHLGHVAAIVSRQQAYAMNGSVERCSAPLLMEDALLLARSSHHQGNVSVETRFSPVPELCVDRHRVLQILVNLITNALLSLKDSARPDKRLIASISAPRERVVRLAIEDNGVGIAPEHAPRLFQHGFTTRPKGHGFGLHNSALTSQELGGVLRFESEGVGRGATFFLDLPVSGPRDTVSAVDADPSARDVAGREGAAPGDEAAGGEGGEPSPSQAPRGLARATTRDWQEA